MTPTGVLRRILTKNNCTVLQPEIQGLFKEIFLVVFLEFLNKFNIKLLISPNISQEILQSFHSKSTPKVIQNILKYLP